MTNKVQKIHKEVEKLKSQLLRGACSSQVAMETRCKEEAYNEVLALLDIMQEESLSNKTEKAIDELSSSVAEKLRKQLKDNLKEEPVSDDMRTAANVYVYENAKEEWSDCDMHNAFVAGTKWLINIICSEIEKRLQYMQYAPHRADTYKELKSLLAYIKSYV